MYIKVKNKKIEIKELKSFKEKIKSLKFNLHTIDYGILLKNKRYLSTYFFCQRVDICMTDKNNVIKYMYKNLKSEKRIFKFKKHNIYILPLGTCDNLIINDTLKIEKK